MKSKIKTGLFLLFLQSNLLFAEENPLPLEEMQQFTRVMQHIKMHYVKDTEDKQLFEDAIQGMLSGLDPHSAYLNEEDYSDLKVSTTGKFGGLGIEVTMENGFVKVVSPIDDTPAQKAGVLAGDLIIRLDDTPVKGLSLKEAVNLMRGEKGEPIVLTVVREGETGPLEITIIRDIIKVGSVKNEVLDENYGYVRVSHFQTGTANSIRKKITEMQQTTHHNLKGLILDLRNNPGGVLEGAVQVAEIFLDHEKIGLDKLIVYTKGRLPSSKTTENASTTDMLSGKPLVVLVNEGSASASEIVAGALQDHKRAVIMGTKTFGKGSVQTVLPLTKDSGLKLTTALYYTPLGRSIQAEGIKPDIYIESLKLAKQEGDSDSAVREADLQGHLENGGGNGPQTIIEKKPSLIDNDYQLREALHVLKGLNILQGQNA